MLMFCDFAKDWLDLLERLAELARMASLADVLNPICSHDPQPHCRRYPVSVLTQELYARIFPFI